MWAAIYNGEVVGMTACVVRGGKTTNSVTVVDRRLRQRGIGTNLMRHKNSFLAANSIQIETNVAANNEGSLKACIASGLKILSETTGHTGKLLVMGK